MGEMTTKEPPRHKLALEERSREYALKLNHPVGMKKKRSWTGEGR